MSERTQTRAQHKQSLTSEWGDECVVWRVIAAVKVSTAARLVVGCVGLFGRGIALAARLGVTRVGVALRRLSAERHRHVVDRRHLTAVLDSKIGSVVYVRWFDSF